MKIYAVSLGCPKNLIDTDTALASIYNYFSTAELVDNPEESDLVLINTCAFITSAVKEAIEVILEHANIKRGDQLLVVIGCLVQRYGKESLKRELPEVDIFIGTDGYHTVGDEVIRYLGLAKTKINDRKRLYTHVTPVWRSYLKISEGCSNRCTFCIIPKIRGKLVSRSPSEILLELKELEKRGIKELTLVAQDLTAYNSNDLNLLKLLEIITKNSTIPWIRLLYLNPARLTKELIDFIIETNNIVPYFDVPIQHASERILRKMGRRYDRERLMDIFCYIKKKSPDAALRTTVMVGFPGEEEEDFEILKKFIEDIKFDHLGVFTYSDEKEAYSNRFKDKVSRSLARARQKRLLQIQREISKKRLKRFRKRVLEVLVEGISEESEYLYRGRTKYQAPDIDGVFYLSGENISPGEIYPARVLNTHIYDLAGIKLDVEA